ncbi:hypothetical protein ACA910_015266 [Epithemia clementina (nom. ined.)]
MRTDHSKPRMLGWIVGIKNTRPPCGEAVDGWTCWNFPTISSGVVCPAVGGGSSGSDLAGNHRPDGQRSDVPGSIRARGHSVGKDPPRVDGRTIQASVCIFPVGLRETGLTEKEKACVFDLPLEIARGKDDGMRALWIKKRPVPFKIRSEILRRLRSSSLKLSDIGGAILGGTTEEGPQSGPSYPSTSKEGTRESYSVQIMETVEPRNLD